ncbi:transglutaminase family protein [Acuticoccus sp. M5D2P5]|uniref:transglutaminase family protein n=1 Tax=Acuticoccus kalidii TaxID=2910977 RepID=UPI001F1E39FB|nr:transglutaminase family protein [Acuticoccus kalidii]MCF3936187.1 transglutaminase family protein [Acuticoccus kalidii]
MRLSIQHETRYHYDVAPASVIEVLRLTPCSTATQSVRDWRISVTGDAALRRSRDAFGNTTHTFTLKDPGNELVITASGTVETEPHNGVVTGSFEPLPLGAFLRETALTEANEAIHSLAKRAIEASDGTALGVAHAMNVAVHDAMEFQHGMTSTATSAVDAIETGKGVCQDLTHVLLAVARSQGFPARYISGYQYTPGRQRTEHESHAWAEIHVSELGWVSFDPTAAISTTDAYVRIACGLDSLGASPVRGAVYGGAGETLTVDVTMDKFQWQSQSSEGQTQTQFSQ